MQKDCDNLTYLTYLKGYKERYDFTCILKKKRIWVTGTESHKRKWEGGWTLGENGAGKGDLGKVFLENGFIAPPPHPSPPPSQDSRIVNPSYIRRQSAVNYKGRRA